MKLNALDRKLRICLHCPSLCLSRCPASLATGNITYSTWGKMSAAWRLGSGLVTPDEQTMFPTSMCLDCLACREPCDHKQDVPFALAAVRAEMLSSGAPPLLLPAYRPFDPENAWRLLRDAAPAWRRTEDCQSLLMPGLELLDEGSVPVLEAIFRVLDLVGDKVTGVNRDSVLECGHLPYACGQADAARKEAARAFARFGRYSRVLVSSPHCAAFIRLHWSGLYGLDRSRQALTLLEHVGKMADVLKPGTFPGRVAWHDPCHYARHLGMLGVPRDLLQWATNTRPIELRYSRERTCCCGGGYPLSLAAPGAAETAARELVKLVRETQADVVAVGCGRCRRMLSAAGSEVKVMHVMEVLQGGTRP